MNDYEKIIIDGEETSYLVYSDGRVLNQRSGMFLKGSIRDGYRYYQLTGHGWKKNFLAHRLVATAFLEKIEGKDYVHHIDGDKLNNSVDNLRWVASSENAQEIIRKVPRTNSHPRYCYYNGKTVQDEVWKDYRNTNYRVSNYGRLWNLSNNRILKPHSQENGYLYYSPKINGKTTKLLAHRAVYESFNGVVLTTEEQIEHIDGDRKNNCLNNLRLCATEENSIWRSEKKNNKNGYHVEQLTLEGDLIYSYASIADAARAVGVKDDSISNCVSGRCPTIKGYKWRKVLD